MKTAIELLVEHYEELVPGIENVGIDKFLDLEKQQIIDARIDGVAESLRMDPKIIDRNASALYYEQTYTTNKETLK